MPRSERGRAGFSHTVAHLRGGYPGDEGRRHTKYTVASGIPELKQAIVADYSCRYGLEYAPNQVVISNGAKHAIHNALMVLFGSRGRGGHPGPYWVSYSELVKLTGAKPVIVPTREDSGFKMTPEEFRRAITPKTQAFANLLASNPTGATYSRQELEQLADIVLEHDLIGACR